ncbi:amidohydrolase family protein [Streptomyces asiaticus]
MVLARDANDEAADAVVAHPAPLRAFATLPTGDLRAAATELARCATRLGHVGAMVHGRAGDRPLDDAAYDDLFATAARLNQPIFIHPQIPSNRLCDAAYRGLDPQVDLGLATFGWGPAHGRGPRGATSESASCTWTAWRTGRSSS